MVGQLLGELGIRGQRLHLADRNAVEFHQSFGGTELHMDELGIHGFDIG